MATQLFGGTMADKYGGKLVMAGGIAWFSLASMLVPLALSDAVVKAGFTLPALLAARCMVVRSSESHKFIILDLSRVLSRAPEVT